MIYDLKAEGTGVETRVGPKPKLPQPARQIWLGYILRALPVSVVNIRAKRSQFLDCGLGTALRPTALGLGGPIVQNEANSSGRPGRRRAKCAKRTQFRTVGWPTEYPSFHYSIIPPFQLRCAYAGGGTIVRNEANRRSFKCEVSSFK
jgi:hypothetical protein